MLYLVNQLFLWPFLIANWWLVQIIHGYKVVLPVCCFFWTPKQLARYICHVEPQVTGENQTRLGDSELGHRLAFLGIQQGLYSFMFFSYLGLLD